MVKIASKSEVAAEKVATQPAQYAGVNLNFLMGDSKTLTAEKVLRTSRGALAVQWSDGTVSYKTHIDNMVKEGKLTIDPKNPSNATFDPMSGNVTKDGIRFFQNQGATVTFQEV